MPKKIAIFAWVMVVWNVIGVLAFALQLSLTPEDLAALPDNQRPLYENFPTWAMAAFGVAVVCGLLGSLLLGLRNKLALPVLILSFLGLMVQHAHAFFVQDAIAIMGPSAVIMPLAVTVFSVLLITVALKARQHAWFR